MPRAMDEQARFANDIARCFGILDPRGRPLVFEVPRTERQSEELRDRLRAALDELRPIRSAPSAGDALRALIVESRRGARAAARRQLAELDAIVAHAAFGRSKRAERRRLLAQILLLFDAPPATTDGALDVESAIKTTRREIVRALER